MMKKVYQRLFLSFCILIFSLTAIAPILSQTTPALVSSENSPQEGTVELFDESLFVLKAPIGGLSIKERAERISQRLRDFAEDRSLSLAQLEIYDGEEDNVPFSMINAGNILLMLITNNDVKATGKDRKELAQFYFDKIKDTVKHYREERNVQYLVKISLWVVIFILIIILIVINNIFSKIYHRLKMWGDSYIRPVRFGNWELIRANQLDDVITWIVRVAQTLIIVSLLAIYLPFVLEQYPWTRRLAKILENYLLGTLKTIALAFLDYLPSLLIIIFVIVITVCTLRLSKPFFRELGDGVISLPGFYPEWAQPTYRIITFLIITLASVIIFPLLPGFQSPAFQGISVFLGLVISLGSTSVISNLISGSILIYTRAFRVGDRIKIGDISGKVLETTLLVTRVLTSINIVVSIPNSQISNSAIENFNFGHRELNNQWC